MRASFFMMNDQYGDKNEQEQRGTEENQREMKAEGRKRIGIRIGFRYDFIQRPGGVFPFFHRTGSCQGIFINESLIIPVSHGCNFFTGLNGRPQFAAGLFNTEYTGQVVSHPPDI